MTEIAEEEPRDDEAPEASPAQSAPAAAPAVNAGARRKKRKLRTKLAALGASIFLFLLTVEVGARIVSRDPVELLYERQPSPEKNDPRMPLGKNAFFESLRYPSAKDRPWYMYRLDPTLGFALLADAAEVHTFTEAASGYYHLKTNSLGLRDERALVPKRKGVFRVLVVGDSMTFGLGVEREEAFPAQLEKRLSKALAPREVEVVNAGVPCWGQREELAFLEHRARELEPDAIVLEFTVANDVLDNLRYTEDAKGNLVPDDGPKGLGSDLEEHWLFQNFLADQSRAYRLFMWHMGRHIIRYRAMQEPWRLERTSDLLARARDVSLGLGASFTLFVAPTKVQLDRSIVGRLVCSEKINEAILARARRDGIFAIDPLPRLRKEKATGKKLYFPADQHWDPDGHAAIADILCEELAPGLK
ncbi:hypothetical protein HY251_05960 [bacterium]|nr:hypothetical protein [bacterium]